MSDLAKEVAEELKEHPAHLTWFQRVGLIVFANVVSLLLVSVLIAAGGIMWNKAMSTDEIREDMLKGDTLITEKVDAEISKARAERETILGAVAEMMASNKKVVEIVNRNHSEEAVEEPDQEWIAPLLPSTGVPKALPIEDEVPEPSASAVREERAEIQRAIDEALYREEKR